MLRRKIVVVLVAFSPLVASAECPVASEIATRLDDLHLERGSRTARFAVPPPKQR